MFGPYDFVERVTETWKPLVAIMVGDPVNEPDFVRERSPSTYLGNVACPLFVIQGRNDARFVEQKSQDLVDQLRGQGKDVDLLVFENEGHDVLKFENRVRCYNAIRDFFVEKLGVVEREPHRPC
jgi:dipeptidyl aminopeptidase/acylaminoacyl peptidase